MGFIDNIRERASKLGKTIVLPEGTDVRIIRAAGILNGNRITSVVLLGDKDEITKKASELRVNLDEIKVIDPAKVENIDKYAEVYYDKRKHKGITLEKAREIVKDPIFFGAVMVELGEAHGSVAGAVHSTADTVRAAFHVIGVDPSFSIVSSFFIIVSPDPAFGKDGLMIFADCAVLPDPNAKQLAEIAVAAADNARYFLETEPFVAMLSFSTKGSASGEKVDKVLEAVKYVKETRPNMMVDGEMQFDSAVVQSVGTRKAPGSPVAGKANTLIFPDLNSANIGYKIAQRMGKAEAVGPFLQGLKLPCNDLSRGCDVDDIVNTVSITAIQASMIKK